MAVFRNAQGYMLSPAPVNVGIGATVTAASTTQVPVLLEDLIVASSAFDGTVSQIRVAGQSIFASSGTVPTNVFSAVAQTEGYRSLLEAQQLQTIASHVVPLQYPKTQLYPLI